MKATVADGRHGNAEELCGHDCSFRVPHAQRVRVRGDSSEYARVLPVSEPSWQLHVEPPRGRLGDRRLAGARWRGAAARCKTYNNCNHEPGTSPDRLPA